MIKYVTKYELSDRCYYNDKKQNYPKIPKNAEVQFLGTLSNFFENCAEIRYNGIVYTVYTSDIEIIKI